MIGDDEATTAREPHIVLNSVHSGEKTIAAEGFEIWRILGDLIEGGIAAKRRFLFGQQMDGREIRKRHGNNPFRGDYSTDAPRGARDGQGGIRMGEQFRSTEQQPNQYGHGRADNRADYSADDHGAPVKVGEIVRVVLGPCLIGSLIGTVLGALLIRMLGLG